LGARRVAWGGAGWGARRVAWGGGWGARRVAWGGWRPGWRHAHWRRGWGWGFPIAAGLAFAAASTYAYDSCLRWNGWQWVNVCYAPYYGGHGYGYAGQYW
jgi:hypothetical protein